MIILVSAVLGAVVGFGIAKRRKGTVLDQLQYAAVYAVIFTIIGVLVTVGLTRLE